MRVVNVVEKFGEDSFLERSWVLPAEAVEPLRNFVEVTDDGWIMDEWPVTEQIVGLVQPWVDEPIEVATDAWFVGSRQETR